MTDNQKQIEFAMRWLMEFGDGIVDAKVWKANEWYYSIEGCISDWESWDWLTEVDARTTIISEESLRLLKGDSDAQQ